MSDKNNKKPNVLFIMDDQHNARCLGCYGNPDVKTPAIDSLAEKGVIFTHAYAQNPICMPSRISFITGQYPHTHGVYGNWGSIPEETLSLAKYLGDHGYQTASIGKLHISHDWPSNGFQTRLLNDFCDCVYEEEENDYFKYLKKVGWAHEYDLGPAGVEFPLSVFVSNIPVEHSVENWTANESIKWLRSCDKNRPFFLWMTFQRPHNPISPPKGYEDMYNPDKLVIPPICPGEFETKPREWKERYISIYEGLKASERDIRQWLAYYYALITLHDENIGRVLTVLDELGLREDTIIVFTSDHGDFAGEHGLVDKNVCCPEGVHRIPFIWSYPKRIVKGKICEDIVESVDFFPTICELVGLPVPKCVEGKSILSTLLNKGRVEKDAAFCEQAFLKTIRTPKWKFNHFVNRDEGELYNMENDPYEFHNLYRDPKHASVIAELRGRLIDFYATTEKPIVPYNSSTMNLPEITPAHRRWRVRWWEEGGRGNFSPLAHLGGPGLPVPPKSQAKKGH